MPDEPDHNQPPVTPNEPEDAATRDQQPAAEQPAESSTAETDGLTDASSSETAAAPDRATLSNTSDDVETVAVTDAPGATKAAGQSAVSAEEVEAAMQEMLASAEQSEGKGTAGNTSGPDANAISSDEVEAAMQEMLTAAEAPEAAAATPVFPAVDSNAISPDEIEAALQAAGELPAKASGPAQLTPADSPPDTSPFEAPDFAADAPVTDASQIDLLDDVELDVKIELGRAEMYIEDVLGLGAGSVVELNKAAGDPVDIYVNDRLVARGEVLVLNENFCVRINDIISPVPELDKEG